MLVILLYNFLPSLEQVMGTIDEAGVVINGQTTPFYMLNFMITNILPLFIIIFMADMITGEYVQGTLKLPLLHPVSRTKLLAAKAIAISIVLLSLLVFSLILSYVLGTAIFGWGDQFIYQEADQTIQEATTYSTSQGIIITLSSYLLSIYPLLAFGMLIMFLALLFNSSGVTAGISIGLIIFLSILGEVIEAIRPYLIINGFALFNILFVERDINYFTITLIVTTLYGIIFYLGSIYLFQNKDLQY
ncbi:ABC transporter permease [Natroniella sulfidigena]|nr:ABC transporter permease [Natroniella sulfidigena]